MATQKLQRFVAKDAPGFARAAPLPSRLTGVNAPTKPCDRAYAMAWTTGGRPAPSRARLTLTLGRSLGHAAGVLGLAYDLLKLLKVLGVAALFAGSIGAVLPKSLEDRPISAYFVAGTTAALIVTPLVECVAVMILRGHG